MTNKRVGSLAVVLVVGTYAGGGCAGRQAEWEDPAPPLMSGMPTVDRAEVNALIDQGDTHWDSREEPSSVRAALDSWRQAATLDPKNLDLLVRLTRGSYFLADGYLRDEEGDYLELMDEAVKWGERAMIAASSEFEQKMHQGVKVIDAVAVIPKQGVPAMYWYATALGKWAKRKGLAVLLGQKDSVKAAMDRCLELDPTYYYGGPHRYFGAYYAIAPTFAGGDLEKSMVHFNKSLEIEPNYIGTKVLWAAELAVKEQDQEKFELLLNEALAVPNDAIAELKAETMIEKVKAKELLANKDALF